MRSSLIPLKLLVTATGLAMALTACSGGDDAAALSSGGAGSGGADAVPEEPITVGGATFTESAIMIEVYRLLLEDSGYTVEVKPVENRELYAPELESGGIDDGAGVRRDVHRVLEPRRQRTGRRAGRHR
jgi:glycine betaine/choline ABC-type transport system substrate-binding protein